MLNKKIKIFQCDEDKMFVDTEFKSWNLNNKIKIQTSPPYHHSSNGLAERAIQTIMDKTRTIMIENNCPIGYWEEAVETAVYLINRTPVKKLNWKTPYEIVYGKKPDISHLVPFYCKGEYHLTKDERKNTFSEKSKSCRMLGYYKFGKNQYLIIDSDHKVTNRRDVIFDEISSQNNDDGIIDEENLENIDKNFTDDNYDLYNHYDNSIIKNDEMINESNEKIMNNDKIIQEGKEISLNIDITNITSIQKLGNIIWKEELNQFILECEEKSIELENVPKTLQEALNSSNKQKWITAISKELDELQSRGVFEVANTKNHAMKSKMIYKIKYDENMNKTYKARLVACGYSQKKGIDYNETFSPTTSSITFNIILCIQCAMNWKRISIDIGNAFLEGNMDIDNYMLLPKDLMEFLKEKHDNMIVKLKLLKSLYGVKQAAKMFNDKLNENLITKGWKRLCNDVCLYKYELFNNTWYLLTVHVDDIIIIGPDIAIIENLINEIKSNFKRITQNENSNK